MSETPVRLNISIIIAAYNEVAIIEDTLKRVQRVLNERPHLSSEIVLVDDGSTDGTANLVEKMKIPSVSLVRQRRNYGQGRALRAGFAQARGDVFLTLDADLSYDPSYIWRLHDLLYERNSDIALASVFMRGGSIFNVPFKRRLISRWGNRLISFLATYDVHTSTCVVRAYRREVLDSLYLESDGMELQFEILNKAHISQFDIVEIPAHLEWPSTKKDKNGNARVSKMKIIRTMKMCLRFGWLSRPAILSIALGTLLVLAGLYMVAWLTWYFFLNLKHFLSLGETFNWSISKGLQNIFINYSYSVVISGSLLVLGLVMLLFSLVFLQNKIYYEETFRMNQKMLSLMNKVLKQYVQYK